MKRIAVERKRRGWSQHVLADHSAFPLTYLNLFEQGRYNASQEERARLAAVLGVAPDSLLDEVEVEVEYRIIEKTPAPSSVEA